MGNDYFWPTKDVSVLEEKLVSVPKKGIQQEGFKISSFSSSLCFEGFDINEEINNMMDGIPKDESDRYMWNTSNDATNDDILRRVYSDFMNEGMNEERNGEEE